MIHWFPGHMAKQFKLLQEKQKLFDLFIVVLDARIPISSFNEEIYKIINNKPILFVINKSDKSNMNLLRPLITKYESRGQVIITNLKKHDSYHKINLALNKEYLKFKAKNDAKNKLTPPLKCVVLGVPNVGKSTLINTLSKSKSTKVGASAGVTRSEQWINCKNYMLLDTPGLLMPKIESDEIGAKLALVGSIRQEAIALNELILALYRLMTRYYPSRLQELGLDPSEEETIIFNNLNEYAKANNYLLKDGLYDTNKASVALINYFKNMNNVIFDTDKKERK
ncbi:ribosome biogenesis GTPase YlqF [Mycoplasma enhydrae]|uniref:ribosome biogenesis GTPase YlqF n=1 Tax=Mycoplasma enhydrae TaxID=2499220 RepID=UPI00197C1AC4|nr:ribosome biogenesis GTPase YlqF [Mycoplasma enhydrae]MBN4089467.1 ribosome biogenesis GTPase YlqF [Mycoplasma enhydrae]MCV3733688.1 ribosome biogenesis GTPase YlqF [Mycoplasma enhydrae]MCV3753330.1 ribosome biogenesis GTPase YlqF [Mycoplasma enhydrae]